MSHLLCPYCGATAVLVGGDVIYPRRPDLAHKRFWKCLSCADAYVGCHDGTKTPLGRLANAELREAKGHAHKAFDPLWQEKMKRGAKKSEARWLGYRWLAGQLGIDTKDCHIGMFDVETCRRVVAICRPYQRTMRRA